MLTRILVLFFNHFFVVKMIMTTGLVCLQAEITVQQMEVKKKINIFIAAQPRDIKENK